MWIVMVTDGTVIEYAPEGYGTHEAATDEARRWAWLISGMGWLSIEQPFVDRWSVGDREVRLVDAPGDGTWVGTFWTWDGYPDPEAVMLPDRAAARNWAADPIDDVPPVSISENEWSVVAVFERRGEEAYAVANKIKRWAAR